MRSLLGQARQLAASIDPSPRLQDVDNQMYDAIAFAADKPGEGLRVYYDDANRGLPRALGQVLNQLDDETVLYLYFAVKPGRHITSFSFAGNAFEECNFYVPTAEELKNRG